MGLPGPLAAKLGKLLRGHIDRKTMDKLAKLPGPSASGQIVGEGDDPSLSFIRSRTGTSGTSTSSATASARTGVSIADDSTDTAVHSMNATNSALRRVRTEAAQELARSRDEAGDSKESEMMDRDDGDWRGAGGRSSSNNGRDP